MAAAVLVVATLAGCDGAEPAPLRVTAVQRAVDQTRAEGSALTTTTLAEGVLPTVRISGLVDFRAGASDTFLHVVKEDGRRLRYQRLVRTPEGEFLGRYLADEQDEPAWRRVGGPSERPGFGLAWDGISLLDAVEAQQADLSPAGGDRRRFERSQAPAAQESAIWVHVVELDPHGRVRRIEFELTSSDGRHTLTFRDYGAAPPVEVPDADG